VHETKIPAGRADRRDRDREEHGLPIFRDLGCLIIDSNLLAREVVEPRGWPRTTVMAKFWTDGEGVL